MMNVHARWLAKVHERMKVELLSHVRIHADETTVQVLKEPNREAKKKSRMWLFCSARCNVPVYVFEYHETRRKGVAQEFLAGWSGTVYGQINVYGVTTKSERHKRSYWTRTADGNGIGGREAPVPYGS